jgi:hypothetical protein
MSIEDIAQLEPDPQTEPRFCEYCEDLEILIALLAADLIEQWERADPRDNWKHTGEHPPRRQPPPPAQPYRTPQATIDAFWYVVRLDDPDYLARWLVQHPLDATALQALWEAKHVVA